MHDQDHDGALSSQEMESLFSKCPTPPWGDEYKYTVFTNDQVISMYLIISKKENLNYV